MPVNIYYLVDRKGLQYSQRIGSAQGDREACEWLQKFLDKAISRVPILFGTDVAVDSRRWTVTMGECNPYIDGFENHPAHIDVITLGAEMHSGLSVSENILRIVNGIQVVHDLSYVLCDNISVR